MPLGGLLAGAAGSALGGLFGGGGGHGYRHLRSSVLPEFWGRGAIPQALRSLALQEAQAELARGPISLEFGPEYERRVREQQIRAAQQQQRIAQQQTRAGFARQGLTGSPQERRAMQQLQYQALLGTGQAHREAQLLNMQREMQLLGLRQAQRGGALEMLRGITQGPVPGAAPEFFGGGGASAGTQLAGAGGQLLGGLLPLLFSRGQGAGASPFTPADYASLLPVGF